MGGLEIRELECFLVLSEELHFGRTAERLYVSQARVSQLLGALERRIGARMFERTSRRVRLSPQGERLLSGLRPAYDTLHAVLDQAKAAARGIEGVLRVGFVGNPDDTILGPVGVFTERHPDCEVAMIEMPLTDPFGPLQRGEVDAAFVCLPMRERELAVGTVTGHAPITLAVSLRHPLAARTAISSEDLADCTVVDIAGPAPRYWRERLSPAATPSGRPIRRGPTACTLQEAMSMIAVDRGTMLFCSLVADYSGRPDIAFVPVTDLPSSECALVWHRENATARVQAFGRAAADHAAALPRPSGSGAAVTAPPHPARTGVRTSGAAQTGTAAP